jgi:hypothetical protein
MTQDVNPEKQTPPPKKGGMSNFQKAMWIAALVSFVLNIFGIIAGIIAIVIFVAKGKRQIWSGILAGIGIGIVALGVSCFAINSVANMW